MAAGPVHACGKSRRTRKYAKTRVRALIRCHDESTSPSLWHTWGSCPTRRLHPPCPMQGFGAGRIRRSRSDRRGRQQQRRQLCRRHHRHWGLWTKKRAPQRRRKKCPRWPRHSIAMMSRRRPIGIGRQASSQRRRHTYRWRALVQRQDRTRVRCLPAGAVLSTATVA